MPVASALPQLDNTTNELSDNEIMEVTDRIYMKTYSSDEYGSVSDHPSEDLSDLALAIRDENFAPIPRIRNRTYSSSDESFISRDVSDDEIFEVTEYHCTKTYSSDENACVSDHPSEDLSDLAQAVRDDSFSPVPRFITRTYSSSDDSLGVGEVEQVDGMFEGFLNADSICCPGKSEIGECGDGLDEAVEDDNDIYGLTDDNIDTCRGLETARTFDVTDPVPTSLAQRLFVMAWNGESSSCGEDIGDIETIPSDEEMNGVEDAQIEGERGSIHTLDSSMDGMETEKSVDPANQEPNIVPSSVAPESARGTKAKQFGACGHIAMVAASNRSITSRDTFPKDTLGTQSRGERSLSTAAEVDIPVPSKTGLNDAGEAEESETDSETERTFQRRKDTKASFTKNSNAFKRFKRLFVRCFGR